MTLFKLLEDKIEVLGVEYEKAKAEHDKALAHVNDIESKLRAFKTALNALKDERGIARPATTPPVSENGHRGAKTDYVKEYITKFAEQGVTPKQIREELEKAKLPMHPNYVYSVLIRAKRKGQLIEKEGRYYPKAES